MPRTVLLLSAVLSILPSAGCRPAKPAGEPAPVVQPATESTRPAGSAETPKPEFERRIAGLTFRSETIYQLLNVFESNEVAARADHVGRWLEVGGPVFALAKDQAGARVDVGFRAAPRPRPEPRGGVESPRKAFARVQAAALEDPAGLVRCLWAAERQNEILTLSKHDEVRVRGRCVTADPLLIVLEDCHLAPALPTPQKVETTVAPTSKPTKSPTRPKRAN